jgi:radical SAM superfamily enzyme YgiQ (UPF0313 family)
VALIWPGDYRTSLSALGYLSIYGFLNHRPDVLAERFFWPDGDLAEAYRRSGAPLMSLESGRPLRDFDLVAASMALENDYWRLPVLLAAGGLTPGRAERDEDAPPVLAGGVALWANPWPLWPWVDLILAGEAEAQWPQLLTAWRSGSSLPKTARLRHLVQSTPGSLRPGAASTDPVSPGRPARELMAGEAGSPLGDEFPSLVRPAALAWPPPAGLLPPVSPIVSPQAEFSGVRLVEISRGCPHGCRFCLTGALFRPHRPWPLQAILQALGAPVAEKVGLVSPAAAEHPDLSELLSELFRQGRAVTLSSLRLTALTPALAEKLAAGRLQGAAVAPEAGSQSLRDRLNKNLTEAQILAGVRLLSEAGLKTIKLYFIMGLPGETQADLAALADLAREIRRTAGARPGLVLSLANFTPKPHTPLEGAAMNTAGELKRKGAWVSKALKGLPGLKVNLDPPLWSITQGLLARGGPDSGRLVAALVRHRGRLKPSLAEFGYTPNHPLHRPWPDDRPRPWRLVRTAAGLKHLAEEEARAEQGLITAPCPRENNCGRCEACAGL